MYTNLVDKKICYLQTSEYVRTLGTQFDSGKNIEDRYWKSISNLMSICYRTSKQTLVTKESVIMENIADVILMVMTLHMGKADKVQL